MYFCRSWFSNMVSFRYVLVFLNFLHDIFSIKFYTISFLWDLFTISFTIFLLMRNITRWMLDTEVKVFHESISYFMKWHERKISHCILPFRNSKLHIFYISYCDVMLKRNEFLWILVGKGFREKVEAQKISFKFHSKTVI